MKYSLFIGKWQPWHKGHKWLIEERLKLGKNILIGIREIENPKYTPKEIMMRIFQDFPNEVNVGTIDFVELLDIESVNYGRDVGYNVIEHTPPDDIEDYVVDGYTDYDVQLEDNFPYIKGKN
jgi:nicotinamide mononucleotide adenylyltransferase